jgi:hypothetical protein
MSAKKHHYVPMFYQRGFADAACLIWRYDRLRREYKQLPPKVNCREEDLYAVRAEDGTWDRRIETDVLSPIDGAAAKVIQALTPGTVLTRKQTRELVMFIALQHTRLPSFGKAARQMAEATMNEWMRMCFGTLERAEDVLKQYERETGIRTIDATSMMDAVVNRRIKAKANEKVFIENMFKIANELGLRLEESGWVILIAPDATAFVVRDDPFVPVPPQGAVLSGMGFGVPGTVCYFPLTKRMCLKTIPGECGLVYQNIDSRAVRTINHNIAAHSERFIMAENRVHLESVVIRSGCEEMDRRGRYSTEVVRTDPDNSFTVFTNAPGRYFY